MNRAGVWYGSSLSRTLQAFDCGHGYAQEEYAAKKEKKRAFFDPSYTLCFKEIRVPPKTRVVSSTTLSQTLDCSK